MKQRKLYSQLALLACAGLLAANAVAQVPQAPDGPAGVPKMDHVTLAADAGPYKIVDQSQTMGNGGIDYVAADSVGRRLYVPRGQEVLAFDLDTLKPVGSVPNVRGHGVAVDVKSHHAFASSQPVAMFDTETLQMIKTIPVGGGPDGILNDQASQRVFVLSHGQPNITVIDAKDGSVIGTINLGGAPEQSQCDGQGHLYADLVDQNSVAVVDLNTLKVTATYSLGGKGGGPAGLGLDAKNHILFAFCRRPATCVILSADDGKILDTLPIGTGTDGGGFNPNTMEAFSSQGDGTLTIIKEKSPTSFAVEQTVATKPGAKTCALDTQKNRILLICTERPASPAATPAAAPGAAPATAPAAQPGGPGAGAGPGRGRGGFGGPGMLDILAVGQ
jgi:DNA-binding beta-propeller fold protein YncE